MKSPAIYLGALLLANAAMADSYNIAKQRARDAGGGGPVFAQPSAPQNSAPAVDPALAATLQNIENLRADIAAFNRATDAKPDPDQRAALLTDLSAAAQGAKASRDSVKALADHLIITTLGKKAMAPQQLKLARSLHALFNRSHLTATQAETVLADVKKFPPAGQMPDLQKNRRLVCR